ncbi:heterocyst differentiation protein HetZ [Sphaerothrix gracilis]|uniref:heterocyst differentiation protein HetZ n=1 Tax=Sphaerothrix gracilis TaxID=3151835 RepID=UPI003D1602F9
MLRFERLHNHRGRDFNGVDSLFQFLLTELQQATQTSEQSCRIVAERLSEEILRICRESTRIQNSGEVENWALTLARHRLNQCLKYYRLGSRQGRVELHSTLSAIIYRYISPPQVQSSYQARLGLIEDFLQGFYVEAINAFRRENQLPADYQPKTRLQLSEYMAFTERYAKRRIPLPGRRSQQLVILRAQTFSKQQPPETLVDIEQATEGGGHDDDQAWGNAPTQRLREQMVAQSNEEEPEDSLRSRVIEALLAYLKEREQEDCADYFTLRLLDLPTQEIEALLNLTPRQRDYLQQRFKYHLLRFALSHHWELVHDWLEADLERNLGLTPQQWQSLQDSINQKQIKLLHLKKEGIADAEIARTLGLTSTQMQKQWTKLLEKAWEMRNP